VRSSERDPGGFDPRAPVVLRKESFVPASPELVWRRLVEVSRWPTWHRGIRFAALRGDLAPGSALHWNADGMRIASLLVEVDEGRRLGWTLRTFGARGYQRWTLDRGLEGGTLVRLEESWEGILVRLLRGTLRKTLDLSRDEWMAGLAVVHGSQESRSE
jgi:hypothetical protein